MKSRDRLHRRFLYTRNNRCVFKDSRNAFQAILRKAEKDHVAHEVQKHKDNSGSLWKIINNSIPSKIKEIHTCSKDLKIVAEDFNQFFLPLVGKPLKQQLSFS